MSKTPVAILILLMPVCTISAADTAGSKAIFTIEPELGYAFGNTQYQITYAGIDTVTHSILRVRSKLVFPLDGLVGGAKLHYARRIDSTRRLGFAAGISIPITNPNVKMTDEDWTQQEPAPEVKVGYTQSTAKHTGLTIEAQGSYGFDHATGPSYEFIAGIRYQRIVQNMWDYAGWYRDSAGTIYNVSANVHALYYRVTYITPSVGLRITTGGADRLQFHIEGAFAPTYMKDYDDHLLRGKDSWASGWGIGGTGEAGLRLNIRHQERGTAFIDFSGRILYAKSSTSQTQHFYADDPGTPDNEAGLTFVGIPYSIQTLQYSVNVSLGVRF